MGIFTKNIAKESKSPSKVSLANSPNYIQFESKGEPSGMPNGNKNKKIDFSLHIRSTVLETDKCTIAIKEEIANTDHTIKATRLGREVNNKTFFIDANLYHCREYKELLTERSLLQREFRYHRTARCQRSVCKQWLYDKNRIEKNRLCIGHQI